MLCVMVRTSDAATNPAQRLTLAILRWRAQRPLTERAAASTKRAVAQPERRLPAKL
jgi:hypothetical protein